MAQAGRNDLPSYDLAPATVLLFDRQHASRRITRQALLSAGMRQIRDISTPRELGHALKERQHDLLVLDSAHLDDGIAPLLRNLRRHRFGLDPFAPVVVTVSSKDERLVQQIAYSGVDHIVGRPFSAEQFGKRLHAVVSRRHRFIETLDYLGPDRRRKSRSDDDSIAVPNALQARVTRRIDLAPTASNISAAKAALTRLRTRNIGRQIAAAVKEMGPTADSPSGMIDWDAKLTLLNRCLAALEETFEPEAEVARACTAVRVATSTLGAAREDARAEAHSNVITSARVLLDVLQEVRSPVVEEL